MASVGVVIPCYKYGHLLSECVASALDQQGVDVRVLIIDDASPDNSADIAQRLAALDARVEVVVHERNRGHLATYNEGLLDWCETDYAVLLSADDRLTPNALTRAVHLLDAEPGVGLGYGHVVRFREDDELPPLRTREKGWRIYNGQRWLARRFREGNGCITSPEVVMRTSTLHEVGGFRTDLPHTGDIELWMRFAAVSDIGYLRGVDQALYRVHDANMSRSYYEVDRSFPDLQHRRAAYRAFLETHGAHVPARSELESAVWRRLADEALYRAVRLVDSGCDDAEAIERLTGFAAETAPDYRRLRHASALERRYQLGFARASRLKLSLPEAAYRRGRSWLWWQSWKFRGVGF